MCGLCRAAAPLQLDGEFDDVCRLKVGTAPVLGWYEVDLCIHDEKSTAAIRTRGHSRSSVRSQGKPSAPALGVPLGLA